MNKQTAEKVKKDGRRADYTDRPLTEEEREFAARPENYNELFKYMKRQRLDQEEWYDILIVPYLQAVKKYFSVPQLQIYPFWSILYRLLDGSRLSYYRSLNAQKSVYRDYVYSLDWETDDMDNGTKTEPFLWIDYKQSVERNVLYKEMVSEIIRTLNSDQREIFIRLLEEYGKEEIRKELEIGTRIYWNQIKEIKRVVADYLSM